MRDSKLDWKIGFIGGIDGGGGGGVFRGGGGGGRGGGGGGGGGGIGICYSVGVFCLWMVLREWFLFWNREKGEF